MNRIFVLAVLLLGTSLGPVWVEDCRAAYLTAADFSIAGMPQQQYDINGVFTHGHVNRVNLAGSVGYVITPNGSANAKREWVWVSPLWLALPSAYGNYIAKDYVESLLTAGYHVVGYDVGTSLGSPKAADIYDQFHDYVVAQYNLAQKARMLGVSNGGLITYGYAFRHPENVDRIAGIYPAVDFTSWPGLFYVTGASAYPPAGLAFGLTPAQMQAQIQQYNPIDNLAPLAFSGVPIWHIHGDADTTVPIGPNSNVAVQHYTAMGGNIQLKVMPGSIHGGTEFFSDQSTLAFLMAPSVAVLPGDYNGDHSVDAADYAVWRNYLGTTYHLSKNGDETGAGAGVVDQADYTLWRKNFGTVGAAAGTMASQVPEPGSLVLLLIASCWARFRVRRRR